MGQALYRKYRSKKLSEIVGQKPITTALAHALESGQISHAYLFTGPRGVGKTSIARILAYEINGIPYQNDDLPIDIIEIDAASNRRIDEIRDLREKVRIAPVSAKYKVYIIDEVHMLTREAFNALLKTLEEPPAHVVFILATTESHKLPETIVSRTQRYTFKLATEQEVVDHLATIAKKEKITIDTDALHMIAKHSGGSMRDALSLLDQVRHSNEPLTGESIRLSLGLPSEQNVTALMAALTTNEPKNIIEALQQAHTEGVSAMLLTEQLLEALRQNLLAGTGNMSAQHTVRLIQDLLLVESSLRPETQLEIALISAQLGKEHPKTTAAAEAIVLQPPLTISSPATRPVKKSTPASSDTKELPVKATTQPVVKTAITQSPAEQPPTLAIWDEVLATIKQTHNTLYSILRMAECSLEELDQKQIHLLFKFPFHQKRMNESKNKQVILDTFATNGVTGYELTCSAMPRDAKDANAPKITSKPDKGYVDQIRNVFGGAEVLE